MFAYETDALIKIFLMTLCLIWVIKYYLGYDRDSLSCKTILNLLIGWEGGKDEEIW